VVHAATALFEMYGDVTLCSKEKMREDSNAAAQSALSSSANTAGHKAPVKKKEAVDAFNEAYDLLKMGSGEGRDNHKDLLSKGIQAALDVQRSIVKKVRRS
jgi:hypothetical protein